MTAYSKQSIKQNHYCHSSLLMHPILEIGTCKLTALTNLSQLKCCDMALFSMLK